MSHFLTIDPGLQGVLVHVETPSMRAHWYAMPVVKVKAGRNSLDVAAVAELVARIAPDRAVIERQTPFRGQGLTSTSSIMMQFGALQGVLAGLRVPFSVMDPKLWRKTLSVGDGKEASVVVMARLQPALAADVRSRAKSLQIAVADAWCMYETARRLRVFPDDVAVQAPDWAA